jgi:hypothetical protein
MTDIAPSELLDVSDARLTLIAEKLESLPLGRFDYSDWVGDDWGGKPDLSCGTAACALGWATTIPELQAEGLRLVQSRCGYSYVTAPGLDFLNPVESSICAAEQVLQLSEQEARYLFVPEEKPPTGFMGAPFFLWPSPESDASAVDVAAHIRNFIKIRRLHAATL